MTTRSQNHPIVAAEDGAVVYVANVETFYEVVAVAGTEREAVRLASVKALQFLRKRGAVTEDTNTAAKLVEWFGISATRVIVGTADYVGNEKV
jgi:hypothetical protein